MWSSTVTRQEKKTKSQPLSLEKHFENTRSSLIQKRKEAPDLRKRAERLRERAEGCKGERHLLRLGLDLLSEADDLEREADERESMANEQELDQLVGPYLHAYNQRVEVDRKKESSLSRGVGERNITAPGSSKQRETLDSYVHQHDATAQRQSEIVGEYLCEARREPPKVSFGGRDDCPLCKQTLMFLSAKSILCCPTCGYTVTYLDATMSSMSYNDDVEFSSFSYKRINHFNEWLQQVQAKESMEISGEIMTTVMDEMYRQRVTVDEITPKKVREVLKQLRLRKAYEHVAQITSRLTGKKPLRIPPEAEEMCRLMFIAVQPAFDKHCPKDRKNFLSYNYTLFKFFQLLGYEQFLDSFSLLKGADKLARQDQIFKLICQELNWEWIETLPPK